VTPVRPLNPKRGRSATHDGGIVAADYENDDTDVIELVPSVRDRLGVTAEGVVLEKKSKEGKIRREGREKKRKGGRGRKREGRDQSMVFLFSTFRTS
jgi:hypothetical protein